MLKAAKLPGSFDEGHRLRGSIWTKNRGDVGEKKNLAATLALLRVEKKEKRYPDGFKQLPRRAAQRQPHSTISRATSADEREQTKPQQEPRSRRQEHQTGNLHPAGEWVPPRDWLTRFFSSSRDVGRERVPSPESALVISDAVRLSAH